MNVSWPDGRRKRNLIGHFCSTASNSDKVYMSCVRCNEDGSFTVIGKYGRRGRRLQQQVKMTTEFEALAHEEQFELFQSKLRKGYVDIDSDDYSGPVTRQTPCVLDNLEDEGAELDSSKFDPDPGPAAWTDEGELVCADALGMEDSFDEGITYVVEPHDEPYMIWVYDRYAKKVECMRERFVTQEEWASMKKVGI